MGGLPILLPSICYHSYHTHPACHCTHHLHTTARFSVQFRLWTPYLRRPSPLPHFFFFFFYARYAHARCPTHTHTPSTHRFYTTTHVAYTPHHTFIPYHFFLLKPICTPLPITYFLFCTFYTTCPCHTYYYIPVGFTLRIVATRRTLPHHTPRVLVGRCTYHYALLRFGSGSSLRACCCAQFTATLFYHARAQRTATLPAAAAHRKRSTFTAFTDLRMRLALGGAPPLPAHRHAP